MALELLHRQTNFYPYRTCAEGGYTQFLAGTTGYGGLCGTTGKPYFESIVMLDTFVYDAAIDRYRMVTWNNIANWPSWAIVASIIHPETGVEEQRIPLVGYAVTHAWTSGSYNGGISKLYATYIATPGGNGIVEVMLPDCIPTAQQIANPVVTQATLPVLGVTHFGFALCPERGLLTILSGSEGLVVYNYHTATRLSKRPFLETFAWSMGYEDTENVWALFSSGIAGAASNQNKQGLLKYNFYRDKIELLTELQTGVGSDRFAGVAWDSKRKKLGAVRIKDDLSDGQHNNAFEIYAPKPVMTKVTVPVNIGRLSEDLPVTLISHVLGTKGEAGGLRDVTIACTPTASIISETKMYTEANGRVAFQIVPPTLAATETVSVQYNETKAS